jgi:hypothetical protein
MVNKQEFDLKRSPVPSTSALQASIISATEGMPQYIQSATQPATPANRWRRTFRLAFPLAACGIVALLLVVGPSNWTSRELSSTLVVSENLNWQEIMLLEDQWLLADL